jgi:hypothetical protein
VVYVVPAGRTLGRSSSFTTCELTVGSVDELPRPWNRMEMVPWFRPPVDTQFQTSGSLGEITIV